jgi:hypothetical protein
MVTDQQVDHYQTFGFLVLPGYLDEQETAELAAELDRALGDGYGAHLVDRENWWGHSLPMMSRQRTPTSLALVEDDRFLGAARRLLAAQVLPTYAKGNLLFGVGRVPHRLRHRHPRGEVRGLPGVADRRRRRAAADARLPPSRLQCRHRRLGRP